MKKVENQIQEAIIKVEQDYQSKIEALKLQQKKDILEMDKKYQLDILNLKFQLKHFKDKNLEELKEKLIEEEKNNAILKTKNEMLNSIIEKNGDINFKNIFHKIIDKLPEVNIEKLDN